MSVPASRELSNVLRRLTATDSAPLQLIVGTLVGVPANPTGLGYVDVDIEGETIRVPRIWRGDIGVVGGPAYMLASKDFILFLGTVRLVA